MRLIDADALMEKISNPYQQAEVARWIKDAPTIEERKTGKWIEQDDGWDGVYYECSVCKEPFTLIDGTPQDNLYNFCPNCGCEMER